jgi:hypothetical protein
MLDVCSTLLLAVPFLAHLTLQPEGSLQIYTTLLLRVLP